MKKLIKGLKTFKSRYYCSHQSLFEQLSHGQHPRVLFITCSDSRIDPNLLTQTEPGEIFVIRNAGNIIPPYGATNGGEGASIEYAIHALNIEHVIVCGHSHCGAIKGLLKLHTLLEDLPLVHDWLKHAEATRRLMKERYSHLEGEELLDMAIAENVLTQIENLKTYPVVHSRLHQGKLKIYAWIYDIDSGEVMAYDIDQHAYIPPYSQLEPADLDEDLITADSMCELPELNNGSGLSPASSPYGPSQPIFQGSQWSTWLPPDQAERIYRGSASR